MNELAIRFWWLTGQVTLLSLVAAGLCAILGRQRPGAGAGVALTGLGGLIVLSLLAATPMPVWWSWTALLPGEENGVATATARNTASGSLRPTDRDTEEAAFLPPGAPPEDSPSAAPGWSLNHLRRLWSQLRPVLGSAARRNPVWSWSIIALLLVGTCFGVVRLFVGLYAVRRCHTNSRPLDDPAVLTLLATLRRAMGCCRPIAVRETADVGGPVTVGWRRPIVLLPPQWRSWDEEERRAVLAHEVAHVHRADYAAWLLARFSVALHCYHPLAHALAARLHLQQELAADALGARHAGGRRAYVRALARLALRQEESMAAGPARAFLPARGTLMRRIAMLRTEKKGSGTSWSRPIAILLVGLVIVGVSGLRGSVQAGDKPSAKSPEANTAEAPAPKPGAKSAEAKRPPFVYCYCSPEADGFYAFRPSVYFGSEPRMKKYADEVNKAIATLIGSPESFPKIEEIEQISGCIFLKFNEKAPKGQRRQLIDSLLTLRTTGAYDWKKTFASLANKVVEVPSEGYTYYKIAASDIKNPVLLGVLGNADAIMSGDRSVYFFQPDPRTVVMGSEQQFQEMLRKGPTAKPAWATAAGWEHVERGVFAAAITTQGPGVAKVLRTLSPEELPADVNAAVAKTTAVVFGLDSDGDSRADLFAACANQEDAVTLAKALARWIDKGHTTLHEAVGKSHDADPRLLWYKRFLEHTSVGFELRAEESKPTIVHAQCRARLSLAELFDGLAGAKVQAVEGKDD